MTRKQNGSKTRAPWSDLDHDVLGLVMMKLGFGDYYTFGAVCKSWRLLACSNENRFMASMPPMPITIFNEKACCYLEDFEGRKFKTILPDFVVGGEYVGLTCGYLAYFTKEARDFWLVNPITRKQLHFPHGPLDYIPNACRRSVLVFSPSLSGWVFVASCARDIWFCIEGKGAWKHVPHPFCISDLCAFKGKIYTISYDLNHVGNQNDRLYELELKLTEPKFTLIELRKPLSSEYFPLDFVSSGDEKLFMIGWSQGNSYSLRELDLGEMKWVEPCENTLMEEYSFFYSKSNREFVFVKQESQSHGRIASFPNTHIFGNIRWYIAEMWYFSHQCPLHT